MTDDSTNNLDSVVRRALVATVAAGSMRAVFTVSYGERRQDDPRWSATGVLDLDLGAARLLFTTAARPKANFREIVTVGADVYQRLTAESDTWSRVRTGEAGEGNMTDDLLGLGRLVPAVRRWTRVGSVELRDGTEARRYSGLLPRRLGRVYDRTLFEVFYEALPFAIHRRRVLEAWVDDDGLLRGLAITIDGPGLRYERKWLTLEVWDLSRVAVEPPTGTTVLTGNVVQQLRQRWRQVRSKN